MDSNIATFLAFTATEDAAVAKQFLELSGDNVEYAVQLFLESGHNQQAHDEDYAQQLQQQAYQESNTREADTNVHRHDTLLDSYHTYNPLDHEDAGFGRGRVGIFNQRYDDYDDEDYDGNDYAGDGEPRIEDFHDDDDPEIIEITDLDEHIEVDSDSDSHRVSRRSRIRNERFQELSSTQRRLALLFKPPFDIMSRISLDSARTRGRAELKWILINIQDPSEFQCQVLNRDFWSDSSVKSAVSKDFIFLQYQNDSYNGESYSNFYSVEGFPHMAILDPMTGERVRTWYDGAVPAVDEWLADIDLFLEKFSLHPNSNNPMVQHEHKFDPDAMSEEQQLEYAIQQSVAGTKSPSEEIHQPEEKVIENPTEDESIVAVDHPEPSTDTVTRVQIRFPNGKRLIHKFDFENDTVLRIYQWLKFVLTSSDGSEYGISGEDDFQISCAGRPKLVELLHQSVGEAGLKNASLLVEKV